MISSEMPSLKYSSSGVPLMLVNGSTAMDFLPTCASVAAPDSAFRHISPSRRDNS